MPASLEDLLDPEGERRLATLGETRMQHALEEIARSQPDVYTLLGQAERMADPSVHRMSLVLREDRLTPALWYDPRWVAVVHMANLQTMLIHEALHLLLLHPFRKFPAQNPELWDIACDIAVESITSRYFEHETLGAVPEKTLLNATLIELLGEDNLHSAESILGTMEEVMSEQAGARYEILSELVEAYRKARRDDHSHWRPGHRVKLNMDARIAHFIGHGEKAMKLGKNGMGGFGRITGGMLTDVIAAKGHVDWKKILANILLKYGKKAGTKGRETTWKKVNRRTPYENPGQSKTGPKSRGGLLVSIDTSGSMADETLAEIVSELNVLCRFVDFDWMQADCVEHQAPQKYKPVANTKLIGRGGTSFVPVMERTNASKYAAVLLFTDGDGECTETPPAGCRVVWFLNDKFCKAPVKWGDVYYLNPEPERTSQGFAQGRKHLPQAMGRPRF